MGDAAETGLLRQCRAAQGASVWEYLTRNVCGRRVLGEGGVYPKIRRVDSSRNAIRQVG